MKVSSETAGWTGWAHGVDGRAVTVTSDRLDHSDVANRWFSKIRSWFALGAPLELLSPLAIARILALVALVTWPIGIAFGLGLVPGLLLTAASLGVSISLGRSRAIGPAHSHLIVLVHVGMAMVAIACSPGVHRVLVVSGVVAAMAVFAGLFVKPRFLFTSVGMTVLSILVTTRFTQNGMSFADAVVLTMFAGLLAVMTALTARTSRLAGSLDPETGVSNYRGMAIILGRQAARTDVVVATVYLGGVSEVRDALGHEISAELIKRAAEDLGQILPVSARVGRGSADEVIVIVPNDPTRAMSLDAHVAVTVKQIEVAIGSGRYLAGDIEVSLNANVGVSLAHSADERDSDTSITDVIRQSAVAARSARDMGRAVAYWDGTTTTLNASDLQLLADLRTATERGELWLAYQPQIRPLDGAIVSVEALLRWSSPQHGNVPPGKFIPLAERTGLIDRLTDWVLAEALDAQVRWRRLDVDISVSVNISPLSLRSVDFAQRVATEVDDRDLPPSALMLEVTESMAFDIPEAVERLAPLHSRGVRISIDDFGTGYTSLSVLPQLPLDELKVDQQFVREARTSKASEAIVVSVCELAHRLGLSAVAEGIEEPEDAALMSSFGFDLLQGYYFARPMPEDDLLERFELHRATQSASPNTAAPAHV